MTTPDTPTATAAADAPEAAKASSTSTDALLSLESVSKIYGDLHALDNVSLEIPRGQWVSIVGPSGSGKTTLMNIVGAMDTATKGTVMLDGHDISDLTADELTEVRCRTIGLVFQQFHLIGHLTTLMVVTHDALVAEQGQREIRLDHGKVVKETWHDHDFEQRASGLVLPGRDGDARSGKDKVR